MWFKLVPYKSLLVRYVQKNEQFLAALIKTLALLTVLSLHQFHYRSTHTTVCPGSGIVGALFKLYQSTSVLLSLGC
jgi:hypothetical protein